VADERPDDLVPDVPPESPDGLGIDGAGGTPSRRPDEDDPYGLELKGGGDLVHSDTIGAIELSAEYTAGQAATDSRTNVEEAQRAWHEAAEDSLDDSDREER
jgi:hypothetical protein